MKIAPLWNPLPTLLHCTKMGVAHAFEHSSVIYFSKVQKTTFHAFQRISTFLTRLASFYKKQMTSAIILHFCDH